MEHHCKALNDAPRAVQNENHGRWQPSLRVPPAPQNEDDYDQRSNPFSEPNHWAPCYDSAIVPLKSDGDGVVVIERATRFQILLTMTFSYSITLMELVPKKITTPVELLFQG